jgi:hypothetical protein
MGLKDLTSAEDFNRITVEIQNEPGLNQAERDAVLSGLSKATAHITDAREKAEKGLKVVKFVSSVLKDPRSILTVLGVW